MKVFLRRKGGWEAFWKCPARMKDLQRGLTLIELLVVVNIVAILTAVGSIVLSEYGDESKCQEIYNVLPQILRSQAFYFMQNNQYYAANQTDLKTHGVDLSGAEYFTY